jgi:hypothetical protein
MPYTLLAATVAQVLAGWVGGVASFCARKALVFRGAFHSVHGECYDRA